MLSHNIAFAPAARAAAQQGRGGIIHFEIMPKNVNKVIDASIPVLGDVVANLASLVPLIRSSPRTEWFSNIKTWKQDYPFTYTPSTNGALMKPQQIIEELDKQTRGKKEDVVITTGVGQHQMWAAQFYRWTHPRTMISSGGLGVGFHHFSHKCQALTYTRYWVDYGFRPAGCDWMQGRRT
jgi:acetolactate synthase I/II/III large subunit